MTFHPLGDSAILLKFDQKIDPDINQKVVSVVNSLTSNPIKGVTGWIPAYCSLMVSYDPMVIHYDQLESQLEEMSSAPSGPAKAPREFNIPVCYGGEFGVDLEEVSKETSLSIKEIIDIHTSTQFRVYMLGFIPGFVYMGSIPPELNCSRKTTPRLKVPSRSVGLAGQQTGIYPTEAPGGWRIIGRTPVNIIDLSQTNPFLFEAGDSIRFNSIDQDQYKRMRADAKKGVIKWDLLNA